MGTLVRGDVRDIIGKNVGIDVRGLVGTLIGCEVSDIVGKNARRLGVKSMILLERMLG